ncbi:hypothetical protein SteCoe_1587 [Stentor coeruleus]|uniref:Tubulin/FtsZ GTPase domain-containing protein n=1 Tax=Stentor coeruleus TaxID=5963 RepID=A0A1R2D1D7_9CILI|nr:hypothetical protein SteCoe_1587 [Stentor coeruleus]
MNEIISLHLGQAGTDIGTSIWDLFSKEHNIDNLGIIKTQPQDNFHLSFFSETSSSRYLPRAIFLDSDVKLLDKIPTNSFYDKENFICGNLMTNQIDKMTDNYILDKGSEIIRKSVENCDKIDGFMLYYSLAGNSGLSISSKIIKMLEDEYSKNIRAAVTVYPENPEGLQAYSTMLCMSNLINDASFSLAFENSQLKRISKSYLNVIEPKYRNLNQIIALYISALTLPIRTQSQLNISLQELSSSLIPYPTINLLFSSFYPFLPINHSLSIEYSILDIIEGSFAKQYFTIDADVYNNKYFSSSMYFRGDISIRYISSILSSIKYKKIVEFIDWCPTGFKCGYFNVIPPIVEQWDMTHYIREIFICSNTTASCDLYTRYRECFDNAYANKQEFNKVTQVIEEEELLLNRENITTMESDLAECLKETVDQE